MHMQDIQKLARSAGVVPGKLSKTDLIRAIQLREGNFDCFATARDGVCDQTGCLWRDDCFEMAGRPGGDGH